MTIRRVSLLGAIGSIGASTQDVIEAHWLFGASREPIEVVVHPQSVIHSLVEYVDGSVFAQFDNPDMRTPIAPACAETLARLPARPVKALADALAADAEVRVVARAWLKLPAPPSPLAA